MILNFICNKVILINDGSQQKALLTKTDKKVGKKDALTPIAGVLNIDGDGVSVLIIDSTHFDTYTEGQSYNLDVFTKPSFEEQKKALVKPEVKKN